MHKKSYKSPVEEALSDFFRSVGPAFMSGRIADIAIDQTNENVYVAVGSGGLWKTSNSGTTWTHFRQGIFYSTDV